MGRKKKRKAVVKSRRKTGAMTKVSPLSNRGAGRTIKAITLSKMPDAVKTKLPYFFSMDARSTVGGSVGTYDEILIACNSVYDPTSSGSGLFQPITFDRWKAWFLRYVVDRFSYTWKVMDFGASSQPVMTGVYFTDNNTALFDGASGYDAIMETLWHKRYHARYAFHEKGVETRIPKFKGSYNPKLFDRDVAAEDFMGSAVTDPAAVIYAHFFVYSQGATTAITYAPQLRLSYDTTFFERILQLDA